MSVAGCVFCEIVDGTRPAAIVASDDAAVSFLDARPVFKGHVLVVPRAHVATLTDLPADALGPYFATVQRLARAVEVGLEADGTFVALNNKVSQSVAHLHTHVVPRRRKDGLRGFFWPRVPYASDAERDDFAARIRAAV
ncbi:MAG TPA: HIT family protein [Polyangia bacterium]|jgi:histidine triad (HIT) family protein|nr:HIT family protein [Polyangia bacterium]